jgi:hypothetical protein
MYEPSSTHSKPQLEPKPSLFLYNTRAPAFRSLTSIVYDMKENPAGMARPVCWVVVLGDFGRSPRMQYHTVSMSKTVPVQAVPVVLAFTHTHPWGTEDCLSFATQLKYVSWLPTRWLAGRIRSPRGGVFWSRSSTLNCDGPGRAYPLHNFTVSATRRINVFECIVLDCSVDACVPVCTY